MIFFVSVIVITFISVLWSYWSLREELKRPHKKIGKSKEEKVIYSRPWNRGKI